MAVTLTNGSPINGNNTEFEDDIENMENKIRIRLGEDPNESCWRLGWSSLAGRGVISTKDLKPGDTIFKDIPLVLGPRAQAEGSAICVVCLRSNLILKPCSKGCRLPICSQLCQDDHSDSPECSFLRRLGVKEGHSWCPEIYRALTPFRCINLPEADKEIIRMLQSHPSTGHSPEVKLLLRNLRSSLSKEDLEWIDYCCRVMNAAAFQTMTDDPDAKDSPVRGLYSLAGLTNHSCIPNTRQVFTSDKRLMFIAVKPIAKGEELTTSYCPLLWATPLRITFLFKTKHFICNCPRCQDATEMGTYLAGMMCNCGGVIMPIQPQNPGADWKCSSCPRTLTYGQALMASSILSSQPENSRNNLSLAPNNHLKIEKTLQMLFTQRTQIHEMNELDLIQRENKIKHLIQLIEQLHLGECRTKGLLLIQLFSTLKEKESRSSNYPKEASEVMLMEAKRTLSGDISLPKDILLLLMELDRKS